MHELQTPYGGGDFGEKVKKWILYILYNFGIEFQNCKTGLATSLMGIDDISQLTIHPFRGSLFENLVVVDFLKRLYNHGKQNNLYYWRDNTGNEIDLLIKPDNVRIPIEIKSGQTINNDFLKGLKFWQKLTKTEGGFLVYAGDTAQKRSQSITIVPVHKMNMIEI